MVTYSLQQVCGGLTATLFPQTIRQPYSFYANHTVTSRFLARCKVIIILAFFFNLTLNCFQQPQCRNHTASSAYSGRTVVLQWLWGDIQFLHCLGCLESLTVASQLACGGLKAPLWQPYGKLVVAAKTPRVPWSPYGHLPVSLRSHYAFLFNFHMIAVPSSLH